MRKPNHCPQQKAFNCKGAYFIFDGPNTTCIVNAGCILGSQLDNGTKRELANFMRALEEYLEND